MDALANFAYSTVATAPSPATSGTTLIVHAGDGAKFPAAPFDLLIWPVNATPLTTNAEIARCTNVSTDTLTITRAQYGTSARTVVIGDQCCQPIDANLFAQLMQLSPGPMTLSGTPSAGQIPIATSGSAASWSTPTTASFPLPGAVNLQGHSYLGAANIGVPEPMTQARYTASRIAGMLGAPNDSVISMTKSSGALAAADGPDGCSWGTVLQRIIPPSGAGLTATGAQGSGEVYTALGQVNPPLPAPGQPTMVSLIGVNDISPTFGYGINNIITASLSGAGGTMTSSTNLSSTGSFAAGRSGGNGVHVGDYITGPDIRGYAQVASVSWNGSTTTTITFTTTAQITGSTTSLSYGLTFDSTSGSSNWANQGVTACINSWMATIARHVAGAIVRSDDAALTYGGSGGSHWTTVTQNTANSGPSIAQTTHNADTVTYTLPATHPGGMLSIIGVGTNDLDASGCSITLSGTAANATGTTTVARAGWNGQSAPIVVRLKTTAADAGKTIIITFNNGSGGTPIYQFDSINFDAPYQSPFIFITQPPGCPGFANVNTDPTHVANLNAAMATVVSNWQTAPSGGFPSIGPITPTYTNVVVSDFAAQLSKKSFYLGSTITTGTTTPITLIGQRTIAQGDQQAPYAGQQLSIPNPNVGDLSEVALITAVLSGPTPSGPGSAYNSWTVTLTRNAVVGGGNLAAVAATGSTSSLISPLYDVMWIAPDYLHPGDVGSALIASGVLSTFLAVPNTANFDYIAASTQRWMQGRTQPWPRAVDGGVWFPKGTLASFTPAASTAYALRYYAGEDQVVTGIGIRQGATGGSQTAYFGILMDASYGSYPGVTITDFGLAGVALTSIASLGLTNQSVLLKPGWYWLVVAYNNGTPAAGKGFANRTDEPGIDATTLAVASTAFGTNGNLGIIGYSWTPSGTSTITNISASGAISPIIGVASTAALPLIWLQRNVQRYSAIG